MKLVFSIENITDMFNDKLDGGELFQPGSDRVFTLKGEISFLDFWPEGLDKGACSLDKNVFLFQKDGDLVGEIAAIKDFTDEQDNVTAYHILFLGGVNLVRARILSDDDAMMEKLSSEESYVFDIPDEGYIEKNVKTYLTNLNGAGMELDQGFEPIKFYDKAAVEEKERLRDFYASSIY